MIYLDTETCGLCGPAVLLQYQKDDGEIITHDIWKNPAIDTLMIIEEIVNHPEGICGFNLAFDWFQICKIYNMLTLMPDTTVYPEDIIDDMADYEEQGRFGLCLKPVTAIDLMLHARKGPYQATMEREDIKIRRVPALLAPHLQMELEKKITFPDIFFAKRKKEADNWQIREIEDADFVDIVLKFKPSHALKALAVDALGYSPDELTHFTNVMPDNMPYEEGYAPFAKAFGSRGNWNETWPLIIQSHIDHWAYNDIARNYARDDVKLTKQLYEHFGKPASGDNDSILACMVGAVRYRGFSVNLEKVKEYRDKMIKLSRSAPQAPAYVRRWLQQVMSPTEQVVMGKKTGKIILETIAKWEDHPAAERAKAVLKARRATKEVELYTKLLEAGRFHASFIVIGTRSSRMSGSDGLNPMGVKKTTEVRELFTLADPGYVLSGGDMWSFEVVLAEAVYNDANLRRDLLSGKKIHTLFAMSLFKKTYDEIMATVDTELDLYLRGKSGVFAMIYGGDENTLVFKLGVDPVVAAEAYKDMVSRYPGIGIARKRVYDKFCSARQPNGIGTAIEWHEPAEYMESLFGFRRYFTLENQVCKLLFELARKPPKEWQSLKIKVTRRDREQTVSGATQSALYAAMFNLQAKNMRAAANHEIQSSGAEVTKTVQVAIWGIQPQGVHEWVVVPMQVHDEIETVSKPEVVDLIEETVQKTVDTFKSRVPLIRIDWKKNMLSWAKKK